MAKCSPTPLPVTCSWRKPMARSRVECFLESHRCIVNPVFSPDGTSLRFDNTNFTASSLWETSLDHMDAHPLLPGWTKPLIRRLQRLEYRRQILLYQSKGKFGPSIETWLCAFHTQAGSATSSPVSYNRFFQPRRQKLFV